MWILLERTKPGWLFQEVLCGKLLEEVHSGGFSGHFAVRGHNGKLCKRYIGGRGCIQMSPDEDEFSSYNQDKLEGL